MDAGGQGTGAELGAKQQVYNKMPGQEPGKEDIVRRVLAAFAVIALLFVVAGCPGAQKIKDLESQVATQQQKITELEGQVAKLTAERDSLQKVVTELEAKATGGKTPGKTPGTTPGGTKPGGLKPPTQK